MSSRAAFERQVETVLQQAAGSSRPVDAMAVVDRATNRTTAGHISATTRWFRSGASADATEGGFPMFAALKLVAGAAVLALFGGLLLSLAVVGPENDPVVPAAPMATEEVSPSTGTDGFPTGTFVTAEWGDRFGEFDDDGSCRWKWPKEGFLFECTYKIEGDLFTEASNEWESTRQWPPATYRWQFDGEYLTFESVGEDPNANRRATYTEQPFVYVADPRLVVVAAFDIEAGTELLAGHTELRVRPGAEIPEDSLTDKDPATGATTVADISKGQAITPDLLEPTE